MKINKYKRSAEITINLQILALKKLKKLGIFFFYDQLRKKKLKFHYLQLRNQMNRLNLFQYIVPREAQK